MQTGQLRLKQRLLAVAGTAVVALTATAAQASAHGFGGDWHRGFYGNDAIVTGTITAVNSSANSFTANAYVVTPGAGGASAPSQTPVTITEGSGTKVSVLGQSGLAAGDTFYATYTGDSSTTPIATVVSGTPSRIFAFVAPTPQVEVQGVITSAPTSADPNQFTATAYVVQPISAQPQSGSGGAGGNWGNGYSYGGGVQGNYGYGGHYSAYDFGGGSGPQGGVQSSVKSHCDPGPGSNGSGSIAAIEREAAADGTAGTVIDLDSSTTYDVDGNSSANVSDLVDGQTFTAVLDGTPNEQLSNLVNDNPALSVTANTANEVYGFVGTVSAVTPNTTAGGGTVSVNVAESTPSGLFTGTDTFDVGPNTFVIGGPGGSLSGNLSDVSVGDVVAGGLTGAGNQTASAIESDPLSVLVDFPVPSSIPGTTTTGTTTTGTTTTDTTTTGTTTTGTTTSSSTASPSAIRRIRERDIKRAAKLLDKELKHAKSAKPTKKHKH